MEETCTVDAIFPSLFVYQPVSLSLLQFPMRKQRWLLCHCGVNLFINGVRRLYTVLVPEE